MNNQEKVKDKIDDAAQTAKKATDSAAEKMKDAAYETGKTVKNAGEKIKEQGE